MASAMVHGIVRIYVQAPDGNRVKVLEERTEQIGMLTGSPDGVIAQTQEKWMTAPLAGTPRGNMFYGGCELIVAFVPDGNATLDISDARWVIPITLESGVKLSLNNSTTSMNAFLIGDNTVVATVEGNLGIHRAPEGRRWMFGGGPIYVSVMDNA